MTTAVEVQDKVERLLVKMGEDLVSLAERVRLAEGLVRDLTSGEGHRSGRTGARLDHLTAQVGAVAGAIRVTDRLQLALEQRVSELELAAEKRRRSAWTRASSSERRKRPSRAKR